VIDTGNDLAAARAALIDLEAAAAASSAEVDRGREQHALGELSRGDLQKLQRRHGRAVESVEQGRARIRGLERQAAQVHAVAAAQRRDEAREAAAPLIVERAELLFYFKNYIDSVINNIAVYDEKFADWNRRQADVRFRGGQPGEALQRPSNMRAVWYPLTGALSKLALIYEDVK
jgi:hypothetical protein